MSGMWVSYFSDALDPQGAQLKAILGGKGASLKEMTRAGLPVPPGFTIVTAACEQYFADGRQWPAGLEEEVRANLSRLEREMGRTYGRGRRPLLVSVRSGAAVSMPGMMDTLLNCGLCPALADDLGDAPWLWALYAQFIGMFARTVHGMKEEDFAAAAHGPPSRAACEACLRIYEQKTGQPFPTDPWDALVQCINAVFASWHSERAVAYRQRNHIRGLRGTAVNVQAMFPSEVSGVVFTQDPTNYAANQMVIEASYGLGEAVVSGDVTPDRFLVPRADLSRIKATLGHKVAVVSAFGEQRRLDPAAASLSDAQVRELAEASLKIEQHFGQPLDIEFGWAEGKFAMLQARPIRGLEVAQAVEGVRKDEADRLASIAAGSRRLWVTHNLGETLRFPTPLTWDIMRQFMSGAGGFGRLYQQMGYRPSERVQREGFLELIGGRIYADPDRLPELFWDGMPLVYDLDAVLADKSLLDQAPSKFDAGRADGMFLAKLPKNLWAMLRSSRLMKRMRGIAREDFEQRVLPPYLEYVRQERGRDLSKLSDEQVIALLKERCARVLDEFAPESLKPGFFGSIAFGAVEATLTQLMGPQDGPELARTLTLALDGDVTFEQDALLHDVAHGKAALAQFLDRFGHRCIGEMELSVPRWRENPSYLEQTAARIKAARGRSPADIHHHSLERRRAAGASLPATLAQWGGSSFRERIERDLADARALLPYRESGKYYLMLGYELLRLATEELGRRWDLGVGVYYLQLDELPRFATERAGLSEQIALRRIRYQAMQRLDLPDVIDSAKLDRFGQPQELASARELEGTAMAPGVATGIARVVEDPQNPGDLGTGYVLVCSSTDPGWTPLFLNAAALVVERGGVLSHGAIVARDFGIPAVACPNATRLVKSGAAVRVDGNRGRVVLVDADQPAPAPEPQLAAAAGV